jgi:F420H(2)-dependent biliverdin reductase
VGHDAAMATLDPANLSPSALAFLRERIVATLTTLRPDGTPHVAPVGFSYDPEERLVRIITFASSVKARNVAAGGPGAVCQVDGGSWLTFEGPVTVSDDPARVAAAIAGYAARYRQPGDRPDRVAVELLVTRAMGRA